jgi:hypothetical protein
MPPAFPHRLITSIQNRRVRYKEKQHHQAVWQTALATGLTQRKATPTQQHNTKHTHEQRHNNVPYEPK